VRRILNIYDLCGSAEAISTDLAVGFPANMFRFELVITIVKTTLVGAKT